MAKAKVRIKQKMCKTGLLLFLIAYIFAVLTFIDFRFIALFIVALADWIVTIIPSYYLTVEHQDS
ncbi:MAG: hypothetical protein QXK33_03485 [Candidatus Bathyarchaeia archaeon]